MATIKDIARLSGYSIGTVSRVINNHPDVSLKAKEKIMAVVEQENFQPNENAKMLKQTKASAITIFVKGMNNLFLESILVEVQHVLRRSDEETNVIFLDESANEVAEAIRICDTANPKGLIFLGGNLEYFRTSFGRIKTPSVLITATAADFDYDNLSSFATDDYAGGRAAAELLMKLNHRKIGIIGGFHSGEKGQVSSLRIQSFLNVLQENNCSFSMDRQYRQCRFTMEDGYKAAKDLISSEPDITAVFALGDIIAVGVLRAAYDLGLKVPDDLSVVGYDGISLCRYTTPRLATVCQDVKKLAVKGVEDLLYRIRYPRPAVHVMIPVSMIEKDSVCAHEAD